MFSLWNSSLPMLRFLAEIIPLLLEHLKFHFMACWKLLAWSMKRRKSKPLFSDTATHRRWQSKWTILKQICNKHSWDTQKSPCPMGFRLSSFFEYWNSVPIMYLIIPISLMDTINHFFCHLVSCAVVPAARQFQCHQHVYNILYTYTTKKPTRHLYFTPLIITFTALLLVDGTVKYNRPLSKFTVYKLTAPSSAKHCSFYCNVFMTNTVFSIVLLVFLCFSYCFSSSECHCIVSWQYWRLLLQCNCLNHYFSIHSIGMCRMRWFLAILRSFFHSSLSYTFSCHSSPPTVLPSSLTSSCHLFLGLPLGLVVSKFIHNTLLGILFSFILCTCPNQRNLCNLII